MMKVEMANDNRFISIVEKILNGKFAAFNQPVSEIYFVKPDSTIVCVYDVGNHRFVVENPSSMGWIKSIKLENEVKCYADPVDRWMEVGPEWIYSAPITIQQETVFYIVCKSQQYNQAHLLQMLNLLAKSIGFRYVTNRTVEMVLLKSEYQRHICEAVPEGYMTVDRMGIITYLNRIGALLLHVHSDAVTGKKLSEVLDNHAQLLSVMETRKQWYHREFFVSTGRGQMHMIFSALPLFDDGKQVAGAIIIFEKIKNVQKILAEMVGIHPIFRFEDILYRSRNMAELIHLAQTAARTEANVLIEGESGTGKELIAQAIHNYSHRSKGPFVVIDCSAIPRDLVESELFGYVDGAFTGARKGGRLGKFELSNGGTVFLDEIGEMPMEMQAKLLRVIQSRMISRVGGDETIPVDFRIIAATNRNLEEEVKNGSFRLDLYYRLNVIHLTLPPLRERLEDIPLLVNLFIEKAARRSDGRIPDISPEAMRMLQSYSWPGNVRELENVIERAALLAKERIEPTHLPKRLMDSQQNDIIHPPQGRSMTMLMETNPLHFAEHQLILNTLQEANGNKSEAAKQLGISRSALYDKMRRYNIT